MQCQKKKTRKGVVTQCTGTIKVDLTVYSGGCSCCSSPELEITYSCNKCHTPALPAVGWPTTIYALETWLNERIFQDEAEQTQ